MSPDRLIEVLGQAGVDFVIVGGVAAVLHGSTMTTRDLGICIPLGEESVLRLQRALAPLEPRVRAGAGMIPLQLDAPSADAVKNLYITTTEGRLDCLGEIAGIGAFPEVAAESIELDLDGLTCRVLGLKALVRAKEAMGRPHDLQTVAQLKVLLELGQDEA